MEISEAKKLVIEAGEKLVEEGLIARTGAMSAAELTKKLLS